MAEYDDNFEQGVGSGASKTFPKQCSALRKNEHVMLKGRPCKIVEMSTSKTGKHGHAKVHLVGLDIFTAKKYEDICPSTHNMECPIVVRKEYQVVDVDDGYASLMNDGGEMKEDIKFNADIDEKYQEALKKDGDVYCTVLSALDEEAAIAITNKTAKGSK